MNINNINVNKYPISQMLDPDSRVVFEIPRYQREYVWGTREWAALYDDLSDNDEGYFLGSIICINSTTNTLLPKFEVVDGQQRLTTISLLLAALYDVLNSHRNELDEDQQSDVLQLKRKLVLKKTIQDMRVDIYEKLIIHDPKHFLDVITENSAIYSLITLQKADGLPSGLRECFQDLQRVQGAPSYLLLMYLLKNRTELCIDDDQIGQLGTISDSLVQNTVL